MRNTFLKKSYAKCCGEASLIYKKLKSRGEPKYIETKVLTAFFYFI